MAPEGPVDIPLDGAVLHADVVAPAGPTGTVVFAHGSGSGRGSPRNRQVASELQTGGLGTVLVDLLTFEEQRVDARTRHLRFDIDLLAARLLAVMDWLVKSELAGGIGVFGASTGAAAALKAAAERPAQVQVVVSRGGRPDLAGPDLEAVRAPTLLIVGSLDAQVLDLNRGALQRLTAERRLEVVAGASHLFEEPGTLDQVAALARDWFVRHLVPPMAGPGHGGVSGG